MSRDIDSREDLSEADKARAKELINEMIDSSLDSILSKVSANPDDYVIRRGKIFKKGWLDRPIYTIPK